MEWIDPPFIPKMDSSEASAMITELAVNSSSHAGILQEIKAIIHGDRRFRFGLLSMKETMLVIS